MNQKLCIFHLNALLKIVSVKHLDFRVHQFTLSLEREVERGNKMSKVAVLGAGSWGNALSIVLADNNHDIRLWTHRKEQRSEERRVGEACRSRGASEDSERQREAEDHEG